MSVFKRNMYNKITVSVLDKPLQLELLSNVFFFSRQVSQIIANISSTMWTSHFYSILVYIVDKFPTHENIIHHKNAHVDMKNHPCWIWWNVICIWCNGYGDFRFYINFPSHWRLADRLQARCTCGKYGRALFCQISTTCIMCTMFRVIIYYMTKT